MIQNDCASLHSTLQHVSFGYQDACSALPALSRFLSKFSNNFVLHHILHAVLKDLDFWQACLIYPSVTHSLMLRVCIDPNLHVDASSSFGVGFVIENCYAGWRLIEGWACESRDIGWAESMALELAIYWLT